MHIIKQGEPQRKGEFHFICENCGCEWSVKFSRSFMEYFAYMYCPNCEEEVRAK